MPFISEAYLRYLEAQMGGGGGASAGIGGQDDLPPAANMAAEPTTTGELPPGLGGPGSYPTPQVPSAVATGATPPGDTMWNQPYGSWVNRDPWGFPIVDPAGQPQAPGNVTVGDPTDVAGGVPSGGQGNRQDDSGQVPGVDLSARDRANMALHGIGLPGYPTGVGPFSGLPPGFTESNRFGGGAPIFTPPGFSGPPVGPGGVYLERSGPVSGGRGFPTLGTAMPADFGGGGYLGTIGGDIMWHAAQPHFGGLTLAQVARMHPELLPGLANMGAGFAGNQYGAHAGVGVTSGGGHTAQQ